ncbi:MAG TPA: VWA domain-containing protein [Vicinamibacterales bacterium]|nr:VWA domain-containing protein [Vicinamibacterales bacterium]
MTLHAQGDQKPSPFKVRVDLVQTDLIARDTRDRFVADLQPGEFEVYEDGIKQDVAWLTLTHGGQVRDLMRPTPLPREGLVLPPSRPRSDASGRIFVIVLDDLHLDFGSTGRVRDLMSRMLRNLIHDGDMFGIVSTGTSSISEPLTYDRQVLESAIARMKGEALTPTEIIQGLSSARGPTELRHRAHVAFSTVRELLRNLETVHQRRKAVLYLSSGYDFNPFEDSRLDEQARRAGVDVADLKNDPFVRAEQSGQLLSEGDLVQELAEIISAANRANATLYTIDPRGLVAGPDVDQPIKTQEWLAFVRDSQDSLRVMADGTGGLAVVNMNDFDAAFRRIDADTSDYYVLGYYSNNADTSRRTRRIEVRTTRRDVRVYNRTSYTLPR